MTAQTLVRRLTVVERATATRWSPASRLPVSWQVLTEAERVVAERLVKRITVVSPHGLTVPELELAACLRSRLEGTQAEPCDLEGYGDAIGDAQAG